jgi:hypothetical protein
MKSNFMNINLFDILKGFFVAVITAVLTTVLNLLQTGADLLNLDWKSILTIAVTSGIAYIVKNLLTNNKDEILSKDK